MCEARLEGNGWEVERLSRTRASPKLGDLVIGTLRGAGGPNVLLVGHMDTVFDDGTVAERPFRVEGDIARGPGVSDMKAGLLAGFFATHVLQDVGFDGFGTITYVCNPDEEIGSPFSGPIDPGARTRARRRVGAGGRPRERRHRLVRARGSPISRSRSVGRAAHAGVEPEKGRNAVLQAAHTILALQGLNGRWPGVTSNVGVVAGRHPFQRRRRTMRARRSTSARRSSPRWRRPRRRWTRICADVVVPEVRISIDTHGWHRPMEKGEGARRLVEIAVGRRLGARVRASGCRDRRRVRREHDELGRNPHDRRPRARRRRRPRAGGMGGPHQHRPLGPRCSRRSISRV